MALVIAEFFSIIGADVVPPTNMIELIPYLLTIVTGLLLVSAVFGVIGSLLRFLFSFYFR